jgi:hypothetical protein
MALKPAVVAWALGFGVFLAMTGAAVVGPPDPVTQLLAGGVLLVAVAPAIYLVLDADDVGDLTGRSGRPLAYLVGVTVASVSAALVVDALLVPAAATTTATAGRGAAFLAGVAIVSWVAIRSGRDRSAVDDA